MSDTHLSRRQIVAMGTILGGMSVAAPLSAQSFGDIMGSAKKVVDAVSYSDEEMAAYFDQMSAQMDSQNTVAGPDDPYGQRIAALSQGLENYDGLDLDIKAYLVEDVNAFAMANGTIRVYSGLMDQFTDDEVRYVIGHEIGHVQKEHTRKRMEGALQKEAALSVAGTASGDVRRLASSELGALFSNVITAQHSQKHERQADDYAFDFMQANNYDAQACVTALDKLDAMSGGAGGASGPDWLSTHPSPRKRARRMRKKLA
ncbi:MAG: M48 family metalloprotease [Erythrobacter sp.]|uniref:M48 family metalloprotease n=1 Tax=Erythrobacter sp. TaxID=1042 RepID=UPI002633356D|nr:M48 family metalloprotease [Erythrobacter sp.]MDJ0979951.1 M48 family metalloprotease [Erythrobacter sp.]